MLSYLWLSVHVTLVSNTVKLIRHFFVYYAITYFGNSALPFEIFLETSQINSKHCLLNLNVTRSVERIRKPWEMPSSIIQIIDCQYPRPAFLSQIRNQLLQIHNQYLPLMIPENFSTCVRFIKRSRDTNKVVF